MKKIAAHALMLCFAATTVEAQGPIEMMKHHKKAIIAVVVTAAASVAVGEIAARHGNGSVPVTLPLMLRTGVTITTPPNPPFTGRP